MNDSNVNNFVLNCSDDECYDNIESNYRVVNGKRVWEPNGQVIGHLYKQLEAKGFIELRWQCPGRRSPSVHNIGGNGCGDKQKSDPNGDNESNSLSDTKTDVLNEFDFETEFNSDSQIQSIASKASQQQKRRSNHGIKKSQTNLTKVMADIKKYQFIDQTRRLSLNQSLTPTTTTIPSMSTQSSLDYQSMSQSYSVRNDSPTDISQN